MITRFEGTDEEKQPLLAPCLTATSPSYWGRLTHYLPSYQTLKSYIPSYRTLLYAGAAVIATLPSLPYIFTDDPANMSLEWWEGLTGYHQAFLISSACIFLGVGTSTCLKYLPEMIDNLKNIILNYCRNCSTFVTNNAALASSSVSAVPIASLAYNGAISLGKPFAIFSASTGFVLSVSMRLGFMVSFFEKIQNPFNKDRVFQKAFVERLKKIKKNDGEVFQSLLDDMLANKELNEKTILKFYKKLIARVGEPAEEVRGLKQYVALSFDATLGAYFAACFFVLFGQAGYVGIEILCDHILNACHIDNLHYSLKLLIATITGISAAVTAFLTGLEQRNLFATLYEHLKTSPLDILKVLGIIACCGVTAMSLANVAQSLGGDENLFLMNEESALWIPYIIGNAIMSFNLDSKAAAELTGLLERELAVPKKDIISYLEKKKLSHEAIQSLQRDGLFTRAARNENDIEASLDTNAAPLCLTNTPA